METYTIDTREQKKERLPKNDKKFTLKEMQTIVGGYIERIVLNENQYMIVNEDGKNLRLSSNRAATSLAYQNNALAPGDFILGDVLVVERKYFDDHETE